MGLTNIEGGVLPGATRPHLRALTGLRIFAALHVFAQHTVGFLVFRDAARIHEWAAADPTPLRHAADLVGRAGMCLIHTAQASVSLFFVLSGFILAYNYLDPASPRQTTRGQFWLARFARLFPVYLLAWLIAAPAAISHLHGDHLKQALLPVLSLTTTHAWVPQWALDWNSPSWALSTETLFYLIVPLLFLTPRSASSNKLAADRRSWHLLLLYACMFIAVLIPSLYVVLNPAHMAMRQMADVSKGVVDGGSVWLAVIAYFPLARLAELLAGVGLGRIFLIDRRQRRRIPPWIAPLAGAAIVAIYLLSAWIPFAFYAGGAMAPLFGLLIYSLAHGGWGGGMLSSRLLVLLGETSYAFYILHVPLAGWFRTAARKIVPSLFTGVEGGLARNPTWSYALVYFVLTMLISVAVFKYIETPGRFWIRALFTRRQATCDRALPAAT